jgi:signal transduction histidine kinase
MVTERKSMKGTGKRTQASRRADNSVSRAAREALLNHYGAGLVLVDSEGQILQVHGQAGKYLDVPASELNLNLFDIAKEGLSPVLRPALRAALGEGRSVVVDAVPVTRDPGAPRARVAVIPAARRGEAEPPLLAVLFEEAPRPPVPGAVMPPSPEGGTVVTRLEEDLRATKRDLQSTIRELRASNEELEQLAHVVSHDLKEPLRMVSGFMGLLRDQYCGRLDAKADEYITFASEEALRMQALIDGLLAYARVGRHGEVLTVDCNEAVDQALQNLSAAVAEAGAVITHDPLPALKADPVELAQLFQNLIGNALKFRKEGVSPHIHVGAKKISPGSRRAGEPGKRDRSSGADAPAWLFSVRDDGIGMAPEFADRIFMIYQRLHTREEYPGTGVGLAICRKIVERHGGKIWVESEPGRGSTFYFTVPG